MSAVGVAVAVLSATGLMIWLKKLKKLEARRRQTRGAQKAQDATMQAEQVVSSR
ncbi:MAG TPA: hypothetical protein VGL08_09000 [Paraburkholderia sp.]|jgi:uncharacterized iron-regulated membrane protein